MQLSRHGRTKVHLVALAILIILCCAASGCSSKPKAEPHRFEITGKVIAVDKAKRQVVLSHHDIAGYMKAMTMGFTLKEEWAFNILEAGDEVSGELVVDGSDSYIEHVAIAKHEGTAPEPNAHTAHETSTGEEVPDFTFINQDGKRIHLRQFRGRPLLLTFIYTRCPLPDYCIRMSGNFAEIERQLKQQGPAAQQKLQMLSISVDPEFDKPQVLKQYANNYAGEVDPKLEHWQFAGGKPEEIRNAANYFGLSYLKESNQIIHSLRTALIGADGKIAAVYYGNDWKPEDVISELRAMK